MSKISRGVCVDRSIKQLEYILLFHSMKFIYFNSKAFIKRSHSKIDVTN